MEDTEDELAVKIALLQKVWGPRDGMTEPRYSRKGERHGSETDFVPDDVLDS